MQLVTPGVEDMSVFGANMPRADRRRNVEGGVGERNRGGLPGDELPSGDDGHFVATKNPMAIADWSAFIESYLATGTATVK